MTNDPTGRRAGAPPQLSNTDIAILQALRFQKKLDSGNPIAPGEFLLIPRYAMRPVRPSINPQSENMMASGTCRFMTWGAPGDGSYNASGMPVLFTGVANRQGTAMMAGAAATTIAMNLMSSRRAKADMAPRWMDTIPQGVITVSSSGFYIEDPVYGLTTWAWGGIQNMEWKAPSTIELLIPRQQGMDRVLLISDWAELIFIAWVHVAFPQHPGKYTWPTPDWADRVRASLRIDPYTDRTLQA